MELVNSDNSDTSKDLESLLSKDQQPTQPTVCSNESIQEALQVEYRDMASWYDWFWGLSGYLTQTFKLPLEMVLAAKHKKQRGALDDDKVVVVDVGCGTGAFLQRLGTALHTTTPADATTRTTTLALHGVEPSFEMLQQARQKFERFNDDEDDNKASPTFWQAPAECLPLPDASADIVVTTNAFHFFGNHAKALQEMRRILKKKNHHHEGNHYYLVITDWCADYWMVQLYHFCEWLRWNVWNGYPQKYPGPLRKEQLQRLVYDSGFDILHHHRYSVRIFGFVFWGMQTLTATPTATATK